MVWCDRCSVMVLSKKRHLCKGDGEVWRSLEECAARWMKFQNIEDEKGMDGASFNV